MDTTKPTDKEDGDAMRAYYQMRTQQRIVARDAEEAYRKVYHRIRLRHVKRLSMTMLSSAALLTGVIFLCWYVMQAWTSTEKSASLITISSVPGMQLRFTLPDSTVVYLNSGSSLTYPQSFNGKERNVSLIGEGYFDVVHQSSHPFIVSLRHNQMKVKVLGTKFNIQSYDDEESIQTTLVTGKVMMQFLDMRNSWKQYILSPGKKASYDVNDRIVRVRPVETICETAWKDGKLVFRNTPMPDVLKQLSHYYNVHFTVNSPLINTYSFTGTFVNRQLSQVLEYLGKSSGMRYEVRQQAGDDSTVRRLDEVILVK